MATTLTDSKFKIAERSRKHSIRESARQHGLSKAKTATETTGDSSGAQKQTPEGGGLSMDDYAGLTPSEIAASLLPPPRNMSREKKLKRVEELEFLIAKNKTRQNVKLAALEKARQTNDFSMSFC